MKGRQAGRTRRRFRRNLSLSTTLAGGMLAAAPVAAQTLPVTVPSLPVTVPGLPTIDPANIVAQTSPITVLTPLPAPVVTQAPVGGTPTVSIDLHATSTIIDWKGGFNIPQGTGIAFSDGRSASAKAAVSNIAVLNRDLSGNASELRGTLSSASNIAVWVYNPSGILVGASAVVNTGSLVLTTLPPNEDDFLGGGGNYRFAGMANSTAAIRIERGASITLKSGGDRGLILVSPEIDAVGTFDAGNQDVVFVTATDVTLAYDVNSPLSVTLNRGTTVATNRGQLIGGSVAGRNVLFALASQGTVTDALLKVDASVTTATASERGIVLSAGTPTASLAGVTVAGDAAATGGGAALTVTGALTSRAAGASIVASAAGPATMAGSVATGGDYAVTGHGVVLGGTGSTLQQADGAVTVTAIDGTLSGLAGLTLQANADGTPTGAEPLSLVTAGTVGGNIVLAAGSSLIAGIGARAGTPGRESDLLVRLRDASDQLSLGNVVANTLASAVGPSAPFAAGLAVGGDLTLGNVDVRGPLSLRSAALNTGQLRSDGDVALVANGNLAGASIASGGKVALSGTGDTTLGTVQATGGGAVIDRDGALSVGGFTTSGDVTIGATSAPRSITVAAAPSTIGGALTAATPGSQQWLGTIAATGAVRLSGSALSVAAVSGSSLTLAATGAVDATGTLTATAGDLAVSGSDARLGRLDAGGATTVTATTGGTTIASARSGGAFQVSAAQAATLTGDLDAGSLSIAAGTVDLGTGTRQTSRGSIDILARTGGISGSGSALTSSATDPAAFVRLTATGPQGILLANGRIVAGAACGLRLIVDNRNAAAPLTLGMVTARSLAATDGPASGAAITTGDLMLTDALALSAGSGSLRTGSILVGAGGVALTGGLVQTGDIGVRSDTGAGSSDGVVTIKAARDLSIGSIAGAGQVGVTAGGDALIEGVSGSDIRIDAAGLVGGRAGGRTTLTATAGDLTVTAGGALRLASVSSAGTASLSGSAVDVSGRLAAERALLVKARDTLTLGDTAMAGGDLTLQADGTLRVAAASSGGAASLSGSAVDASGRLAAARALLVKARDALTLGDAAAGGDLTLQAGGAIAAGQLSAGGGAAISGGSIELAGIATGGALTLAARDAATIGTGTAKGALSLTAASVTAASLDAGADLTASITGAAKLTTVRAGGALTVKAGDVTAGSTTAGTTLALTSAGNLSLATGTAGGAATVEAGGLATLGAVSAGSGITLRAADAELTGTLQAGAITIQNRAPETSVLRLGDGVADNGFRLTNAEVARLVADTVTFDQGSGAVQIGTLSFAAATGRKEVDVLSTGAIGIDGVVSGSGIGRRFVIGGSAAADTDVARSIMVAATSAAGGRLLFDDADLELRGSRIAAGLAPGFVSALATGGTDVASGFVNNANSALYNASLGGGFYAPGASTILAARTLTVRYGDYALFQNTAVAGLTSGAVLGGHRRGAGSSGAHPAAHRRRCGQLRAVRDDQRRRRHGRGAARQGRVVARREPRRRPDQRLSDRLRLGLLGDGSDPADLAGLQVDQHRRVRRRGRSGGAVRAGGQRHQRGGGGRHRRRAAGLADPDADHPAAGHPVGSGPMKRVLAASSAVALCLATGATASAPERPDTISLGRSAAGEPCAATRDWRDPAVPDPFARSYAITCRGVAASRTVGAIRIVPARQEALRAIENTLACGPAQATMVAGRTAQARRCFDRRLSIRTVRLDLPFDRGHLIADAAPALLGELEEGVAILTGAKPVSADAARAVVASFDPASLKPAPGEADPALNGGTATAINGLASLDASRFDPAVALAEGVSLNHKGLNVEASRVLNDALSRLTPASDPAIHAELLLEAGLADSNIHFAEAAADHFAQAETLMKDHAGARSAVLQRKHDSYLALDAISRRQFAAALAMLDRLAAAPASAEQPLQDPATLRQLNQPHATPGSAVSSIAVPNTADLTRVVLDVQVAWARSVALASLGDAPGAMVAIDAAAAAYRPLVSERINRAEILWLGARVERQRGRLLARRGQIDPALANFDRAVDDLRRGRAGERRHGRRAGDRRSRTGTRVAIRAQRRQAGGGPGRIWPGDRRADRVQRQPSWGVERDGGLSRPAGRRSGEPGTAGHRRAVLSRDPGHR